MRAPITTKHRVKLPTAGDSVASAILAEARENLNHHETEPLSAADLLYLKRQVQRRLGGGAEVGQMKAEAERDQRDDLARELVKEYTLAGLELPHLSGLSVAELERLKAQMARKRHGGAKKFRSRTSDQTPFLKYFSIPEKYRRSIKSWSSSVFLCFLACLFFAVGVALLVAYNL